MKKIISCIILISFILSSCYVYRPFNPDLEKGKFNVGMNSSDPQTSKNINNNKGISVLTNGAEKEDLFTGLSKEDSIQKVIKPNKFYKIRVNDKMYKVQAQKWEADSLVSHIKNKPEKIVKVHKNQIEEVLPRRFSKVGSDGLSIAIYITAAVALVFLL